MLSATRVSSGINGLDEILNSLRSGDNVVFQVDEIDDYKSFVLPYVNTALQKGMHVVYMRFARHAPLLNESGPIAVYKLNADAGFESFSTQVHNIIRIEGRDVFYVFDCLSDLLHDWATDLMLGNFFFITCPYLYELNTLAYFAIQRNRHSFKAIARIRETTQLLLDIYNYQGKICVHPLKVWRRYSPTMFLPHIREGEKFVPITNSADAASLFTYLTRKTSGNAERNLDYWDRMFLQAKSLLDRPHADAERLEMVEKLSRALIGREKRILSLIRDHFSLEDLVAIKERLIGSGYIGGKSAGMLLARNILRDDGDVGWSEYMELHDSFYIGSDVFYSYIVQNGWWKLLMSHKTKEGYFESGAELREKMLTGVFPEEVREQFQIMLEYYGQSPIIVRSSSLLEDAFGNAFAGKYESFFRVNQESPNLRYDNLEDVIRQIFACTMNVDALTYRLQRGMDQQDEQMALLVQRVSGAYRKRYFFPDLAGVGLSHNTFVWQKGMDPQAGMLRLVLGLGTRAVNRVENDYPRIVALDAPLVKPHAKMEDARRFSQHDVDVLNLEEDRQQSISVNEVINDNLVDRFDLIAVKDIDASNRMREMGRKNPEVWTLTFDELLSSTEFPGVMQKMLKKLEAVYQYPVDIEFTVNFNTQGEFRINLLQCRPFQAKGTYNRVDIPDGIAEDRILLRQEGNFMGGSVFQPIARIIMIDPKSYVKLSLSEKYDIARLVGRINKTIDRRQTPTILFGPGRWGTTTPAMGVPVTFSEINNITVIAEVSYRDGSLIPDLSFGTHFFQDLVEMDIFYMAIYPEKEGVLFNNLWLYAQPNILEDLSPQDSKYKEVVHVGDVRAWDLRLLSDMVTQRLVCYCGEKAMKHS
jgi:hypothetical protein